MQRKNRSSIRRLDDDKYAVISGSSAFVNPSDCHSNTNEVIVTFWTDGFDPIVNPMESKKSAQKPCGLDSPLFFETSFKMEFYGGVLSSLSLS